MKKSFLAVPLSVSLLLPTAAYAADMNHSGNHQQMTTKENTKMMKPTVSSPAADLRATLDELLSEHSYLAVVAMQKGIDGAPDFEQAAGALNENTNSLSKAIASVYGEAAGNQFKEIWGSHIGYFVDYVKATGAKDEAAKQMAIKNLDQYRVKQADFLDKATEGRLKAAELREGLNMHVHELLSAFDNYVKGDYTTTYKSVRESINHMYGVGKSFSWAITDQFPQKFNNTKVDTAAVDLRENLNSLLSEHAALAVLAMQKGIDGAKDFEAAAEALNQNTDDLSKAIASVYGQAAGDQFKTIWSSHIGYFVDYVKATGAKDEAAKQMAMKQLDQYRVEQAKFLDDATGGRLKAADLESGLKVHVDELLKAFNTYTEKDYATTYPTIHEAYEHMFMVGEGLSGAIVDQFPQKFQSQMPTQMPKTGMGGTAESGMSNSMIAWGAVAFVLAGAFATIIVRRNRQQG